MKEFFKLLGREFKLFLTNRTLLSVFFLAPFIYALLIGSTYKEGKVTDIPVILVNYDKTPTSQQLVDMLEDNSSIKILNYEREPSNISDEVIRTEAAAVVVIPDRFEAMMLQQKYPEVNVYVNTANVLTANFATKALQVTLGTFSAGAEMKGLQKKGLSPAAAATKYEPFKANYVTLYNTTSNYLVFMWPGMMAVVLQQVILLAMAVSFAEEFKRDSFFKAYQNKKRYASLIMLIKCLPIWLFSLINVLMFYGFSKVFMIPAPVDIVKFMLITFVFVLSCTLLGIVMSVLIPDALKATQILMVIASPAFIISGFTWPRYAMPPIIEAFTQIIPLTPYLEALKIMLVQKGSSYLALPFMYHLLIQSAIFLVLGWIALKIKLNLLFKKYNKEESVKPENISATE